MKKIQSISLIVILVLIGSQPVWSAVRNWQVDKAHSALAFQVDHIFSKTFGMFNEFDAKIDFDPAALDQSSVNITLRVDSIDTHISKRDKHLLSPDFFDAGRYPLITFVSTSITRGEGNVYNIAGSMQVKGETYEQSFPLQFLGPKDHPMQAGSVVAGFNIDITIDRLKYGIGDGNFYKKGLVGKDVGVQLSIEGLSK